MRRAVNIRSQVYYLLFVPHFSVTNRYVWWLPAKMRFSQVANFQNAHVAGLHRPTRARGLSSVIPMATLDQPGMRSFDPPAPSHGAVPLTSVATPPPQASTSAAEPVVIPSYKVSLWGECLLIPFALVVVECGGRGQPGGVAP